MAAAATAGGQAACTQLCAGAAAGLSRVDGVPWPAPCCIMAAEALQAGRGGQWLAGEAQASVGLSAAPLLILLPAGTHLCCSCIVAQVLGRPGGVAGGLAAPAPTDAGGF